METKTYKNPLTLDGRLENHPTVTLRKVEAIKALYEDASRGQGFTAKGRLLEVLTNSDAIYAYAALANINFVPNYDDAPRTWSSIAGQRTVPDFRPAALYSLNASWNANGAGGNTNVGTGVITNKLAGTTGGAPHIGEGQPYPYAYFSGELAAGGSVGKYGFKTSWSLEERINNGTQALDALPAEMLSVALDTEEADVYGALINGANVNLAGGTNVDGTIVPANSPLSRDALIRAMFELSQRQINGRFVQVTGGYNLIVPVGQTPAVQFMLSQNLVQINKGTNPQYVLGVQGYDPLAGISIVESQYVAGTNWYLLPKPGATRRPILEHLNLRGFETPQVSVEGPQATAIGGGSISPFDGSFVSDTIDLRLRGFSGAVAWDGGIGIVHSTGAGA